MNALVSPEKTGRERKRESERERERKNMEKERERERGTDLVLLASARRMVQCSST
jgi:hypothetical protein